MRKRFFQFSDACAAATPRRGASRLLALLVTRDWLVRWFHELRSAARFPVPVSLRLRPRRFASRALLAACGLATWLLAWQGQAAEWTSPPALEEGPKLDTWYAECQKVWRSYLADAASRGAGWLPSALRRISGKWCASRRTARLSP